MRKLMQILALIAVVFVSSAAFIGCDDTIDGVGEDVEEIGEEIGDAAD